MNFLRAALNFTETQNGALTLKSSGEHLTNLYFNYVRNSDTETFYNELTNAWNKEEKLYLLKYIAHIRDIEEGKGERKLFLDAALWLYNTSPENFNHNIRNFVSVYGRWRDIVDLYVTTREKKILDIVKEQIQKDVENLENNKKISLLAKWIPSEGKKDFYPFSIDLIKVLGISKQQFRKMISKLRTSYDLVETMLCNKNTTKLIIQRFHPYVCIFMESLKMFSPRKMVKDFQNGKRV